MSGAKDHLGDVMKQRKKLETAGNDALKKGAERLEIRQRLAQIDKRIASIKRKT